MRVAFQIPFDATVRVSPIHTTHVYLPHTCQPLSHPAHSPRLLPPPQVRVSLDTNLTMINERTKETLNGSRW